MKWPEIVMGMMKLKTVWPHFTLHTHLVKGDKFTHGADKCTKVDRKKCEKL